MLPPLAWGVVGVIVGLALIGMFHSLAAYVANQEHVAWHRRRVVELRREYQARLRALKDGTLGEEVVGVDIVEDAA